MNYFSFKIKIIRIQYINGYNHNTNVLSYGSATNVLPWIGVAKIQKNIVDKHDRGYRRSKVLKLCQQYQQRILNFSGLFRTSHLHGWTYTFPCHIRNIVTESASDAIQL